MPQRLLGLALGAVAGVGAAACVVVVDRVQRAAVLGAVDEAAGIGACRLHDQLVGEREVAVEALADLHRLVARLDRLAEAPHRQAAGGRIAAGEEVPVAHRLAEGGVGDVVRGQGERVDPHSHLSVGKVG